MNAFSKITVIIPFYNAEKYLSETVESVLKQTLKPCEIILVDDGSTDNSIQVAERYESVVTIIRQPNRGAATARNTGLKQAKGEFIAFLDADDYWKPEALEHLSDALPESETHDMAFASMKEFISPELGENSGLKPREDSHTRKGYMIGTGLIRKKLFGHVGLFNETLHSAEFIDWVSRAKDSGYKDITTGRVILYRRLHLNNSSKQKKDLYKDYTKVLRAALARKRGK